LSALPQDATEASRVRYQLASELAQACPRELGQEIALTGSVSRGVADADSDIELNFWTDQIPPGSARERWLREMGADPMVVDAMPGADGTAWVICFMRGVQIEAGWQSIEQQRKLVGQLANGSVLDHQRLIVAEMLRTGISLRSAGLLTEWQAELAEYPPTLGGRLVEQAVERWSWPPLHRALAARGESLAVTSRLLGDVHAVLRILFALNRQWEPDWKWLRHRAGALTITPERLADRIDEILLTADLVQAVDLCFRLVLDTLRLLPPDAETARASEIVTDCLRHPGR
jgi:hypothetical protein